MYGVHSLCYYVLFCHFKISSRLIQLDNWIQREMKIWIVKRDQATWLFIAVIIALTVCHCHCENIDENLHVLDRYLQYKKVSKKFLRETCELFYCTYIAVSVLLVRGFFLRVLYQPYYIPENIFPSCIIIFYRSGGSTTITRYVLCTYSANCTYVHTVCTTVSKTWFETMTMLPFELHFLLCMGSRFSITCVYGFNFVAIVNLCRIKKLSIVY
jgi:hypothetical protein